MGGVKKTLGKLFGGDNVRAPHFRMLDYEAERRKAEAEAMKRRSGLISKGMSGTILGGTAGGAEAVRKKKLLGE